MTIAPNTPILVGAGQYVQRDATLESPMQLASRAAAAAVADCGGQGVAEAIDTIAVVRQNLDSVPTWACPFGRSNNPPESVAKAIGAQPTHRIYSEVGGNQPQQLVIEMALAIARGEKSMVLLTGAEATRNQRKAERNGETPDWSEHHDADLDDRGFGEMFVTMQERKNGLIAPMYYYALIEQARRTRLDLDVGAYRRQEAELMAGFNAVAAGNPYAQFPVALDAEAILDADPLTHVYSKRMIAQDGVNLAAAVLMCSAGKARELGIPEDKWVYIHGAAEGSDVMMSEREDPGAAPMAAAVVDHALDMAGIGIDQVSLIDIYSCFPCAVTAIADHLGLPVDGSRALTLTGGLPYFGGPGNNYSMHAVAEAVWRCRTPENGFALVTANGGMLSKHASAVYSRRASELDWLSAEPYVSNIRVERKEIAEDPGNGRVISYTLNYLGDNPVQVIAMAETSAGERFVCCTAAEDQDTVRSAVEREPTGRRILVAPPEDHTLHFKFADAL